MITNPLERIQNEIVMARKNLENIERFKQEVKIAQEDLEGVRQELAKYQQEEKRLSSIMEQINMFSSKKSAFSFLKKKQYEYEYEYEYEFYEKDQYNPVGTCYIYRTKNPLSFKRNETFENLNILVNNKNIFSFEEVKRYGMCNLMNLYYTFSTLTKLVSEKSGGKYYKKTFNRPMGKAKQINNSDKKQKYIGKKIGNKLNNSEEQLNSGYLFSGLQRINDINCQVFLKVKASGENAEEYTLEEIVLIPFNNEICNSQNQPCSDNLTQKFILSKNVLQGIIEYRNITYKFLMDYPDVIKYLIQLYNSTFLLLIYNNFTKIPMSLNDYLKASDESIHKQLNNIYTHYGLSG
jgi:hypothetical protein